MGQGLEIRIPLEVALQQLLGTVPTVQLVDYVADHLMLDLNRLADLLIDVEHTLVQLGHPGSCAGLATIVGHCKVQVDVAVQVGWFTLKGMQTDC